MAIYFRTFYMAKCTNIVKTFLVIYISAQSNVNISLTHAGRGGGGGWYEKRKIKIKFCTFFQLMEVPLDNNLK